MTFINLDIRSTSVWQRILLFVITLGFVTSAPAADSWIDARVFGPFVCRADFSLTGHDQVFNDLANIQNDLTKRFGVPASTERIEVYLFRNRTEYTKYLRRWYPNVPSRRALYIKNGGPGMVLVYRSEDLHTDIRHECTHALLHASLPMVPLWLDEGLAEYYEVPPNQRAHGNPHRSTLIWHFRFGQVPAMERLESKQELADMGRSEYRSSWAWVHFMTHGPAEARAVLVKYLEDIYNGTPPGQLSVKLRQQLTDPKRAMVQHFKTFREK